LTLTILDLPLILMGSGLIWMGSGLTERPSMPQVARCLWGGGFTSTLTIAGDLRNTPRTSPISAGFLSMTGEAGVVAPKILSAELADPDNRDVVFSDGDTLTITFDSETNRAISRVEGYDDENLA
jgi:hypothetical protein